MLTLLVTLSAFTTSKLMIAHLSTSMSGPNAPTHILGRRPSVATPRSSPTLALPAQISARAHASEATFALSLTACLSAGESISRLFPPCPSPYPSVLRLHPNRYRTQLCKDTMACNRPVCFFAHSLAELRTPPPGLGLGGAIENDSDNAWPSSLLNSAAALRGSEPNLMKVPSEPIARSILRPHGSDVHSMMGAVGGRINGFGNGPIPADPSVLVSTLHPSHCPTFVHICPFSHFPGSPGGPQAD